MRVMTLIFERVEEDECSNKVDEEYKGSGEGVEDEAKVKMYGSDMEPVT